MDGRSRLTNTASKTVSIHHLYSEREVRIITNQIDVGWGFWLAWVIATAIGFIIGGAVSGTLVLAAEYRFANVTSTVIGAISLAAAEAVAFSLHGAVLGCAQWFVLRNAIARPGLWIVATADGSAAGCIVNGILGGA